MTRVLIDAPGPPWAGGRGAIALPASHRNGFRPRFQRHNKLPQPKAVTQSELALAKQSGPPTQDPESVNRRPRQPDKALKKRLLRFFWQRQEYHIADARPERGAPSTEPFTALRVGNFSIFTRPLRTRCPLQLGATISGVI